MPHLNSAGTADFGRAHLHSGGQECRSVGRWDASGPKHPVLSTPMRQHAQPPGTPGISRHVAIPLLPLSLLGVCLLLVALAGIAAWKRRRSRSTRTYVPWEQTSLVDSGKIIVCDCTHPKAPTFSHHKGHRNPHGLRAADTSTGIVLNALTSWTADPSLSFLRGETSAYLQRDLVTTNHFDIDSFLSIWCFLNRDLAKQHEAVLRATARIGDFREALLSPELVSRFGTEDGVTNVREAFTALKLACWINTIERQVFTAPYESKDCQQKFEYFLPSFAAVLADPESQWSVWQEEYKQVVAGFDQLQGPGCSVSMHKEVGLAVLRCPEPLHYYSLFSHTVGCDFVLMMYDHNRYELECKYTQFVQVHSRPVMARLDLTALATVLNSMEEGLPDGTFWVAPRFTDTGPVLRLESAGERLSKAQRYGHPTGRPFMQSSLPPEVVSAVVLSFLEFGLQGARPRRGGFSWEELHRLNQELQWSSWVNAVLDQHDKGELGRRKSSSNDRRLSSDALHMEPSSIVPKLSEPSKILTLEQAQLLAGTALPAHLSFGTWHLAYSTQRDGFSLHTLYRKAVAKTPTLLVVKDLGGNVFGAYAAEAWRVHARFYGTGETSVFQMHPRQLLWRWSPLQGTRNDFFQFSTHEGLGVGGSGHFALWLDNDLFEGTSAPCNTFASPCLASKSDFHVQDLELWHVL